ADWLQATIFAAANRLGVSLPAPTVAAAASAIAAANERIGEIPLTSDWGYLTSLYRVEWAAQGPMATDLARPGAGQLAPDELLAADTGAALDVSLSLAPLGNIVPPTLSIADASAVEGDTGFAHLTFRVTTPV